ncbi:hypothetical protein FBD94_14720 [Pedobacter hiemivivus]|uniref:RHS repeat protein n=1 Tax=Pedobacter hiemivivus TaxID=2530454 RepID=A0A4U1G9D1_9SPHI|nr:hypothetical protein [Pedobacter hiemivivus]TKC60164.1 hypothetical protein FBD94_14720 [Pedobacter hiemivivus]
MKEIGMLSLVKATEQLIKYKCIVLFIILGLLGNRSALAQIDINVFKPIEILPNTPDVAGLTKNAHASVSLHTGAISQNIPLLTFTAKRLNVPVSISYNSNGIKVDQVSSTVGLGWNLNAGGFISRTVLGQPDENVSLIEAPNDLSDPVAWDNFVENLLMPYADNQPDLFTFSVEGTTGTFIVESLTTIRKLDENNFKIEGNPASGFVITTPKGVRYSFHEVEEVKIMNNCETGGGNRVFIPNSWLLSLIEHPLGESISFEYYSKTYSHSSSVTQTVSRLDDPAAGAPMGGAPMGFPYRSCATTQYNMGKFLAKMSSSLGGSVTFQYQNREDISGSLKLEYMIIKEKEDHILKTIKFNHSYSQSTSSLYDSEYCDFGGKRLFLDSLNIIGESGGKESYSFSYIDKNSLPPRLSYAKDRFGFFNGKNNLCLIPKPGNSDVTAVQLGIPNFGDRTPSSIYAQVGLLNGIHFPSGGADSILFEPHIATNPNASCSRPSVYVSGESTFKVNTDFSDSFTIACPEQVRLHFACTAIGGIEYDDQYYMVSVNIFNASNQLVYSGYAGKNEVKNVNIGVSPGVYSVVMGVKGLAQGNFEIEFPSGGTNPFIEVGGLRVKEILKMDKNEVKEVVSYVYTINGIESPLVADPMPFYNNTFLYFFASGVTPTYTEYMSFSFFDFPQYSGNSVGYDDVVERFGRNAENGSITHKFNNFTDGTADVIRQFLIPGAPLSYSARKSGQEFYTSFLDNEGKLKKEIRKYYSDKAELSRSKQYYIARNRSPQINRADIPGQPIIGVDINRFELASSWNKLDSVITNIYSEKNGQVAKLVEKEAYDYGNVSHLLPTSHQKTGSDGKKTFMNITYPDDYALGDLFLNNMKTNYLKEYPIELTRYTEENGVRKLVGGDLINYSSDGKGKINSMMNLELSSPLLLEQFKFSNKTLGQLPFTGAISNFIPSALYKAKIIYNDYDLRGNPLQSSQENGIATSYIWGCNGRYLLAQIVNAGSEEVKNALGGSTVIDQLNSNDVSDLFVQQKMSLLRQVLVHAQITSYTYKPSIGMTSATDPKGMTSYYEYDDFQRLKCIKDQQGNIVKSYDYHYKSQTN